MRKFDLDQAMNKNLLDLENLREKVKSLSYDPKVMDYLNSLTLYEVEKNKRDFLSRLEVGSDGNVFAPYKENCQKGLSSTHHGLSEMLKHAFALKYYQKKKRLKLQGIDIEKLDFFCLDISYDEFLSYLDNAEKKLTDMRYMDGDPIVCNSYGFQIYKNPKENSVVNFRTLIPSITKESLKNSYNLSEIDVYPSLQTFCFEGSYKQLNLSTLKPLILREQEAFYGKDAILSLGYRYPMKGKVYRK